MRSEPVVNTPSLSASRCRSSSPTQGPSFAWLSSTSKRSRSFSTTSPKVARVTRIFCLTLSPETTRAAAPPLSIAARLARVAVEVIRQPQRHPRPQIHDDHADDDDDHVGHHAGEDLVERDMLGRHAL